MMKARAGVMLAAVAILAAAASAQTGSIELRATATPTAGRPEPVRNFLIFLLSKSYTEIQKEAEAAEPAANLEAFVDSLSVSPQLKAWMKRTQSLGLSGPEFTRTLTSAEIMGVPEFLEAYLARNAGDVTVGFPKAKYDERDKERNPEKYERQRRDYLERIRRTIETYPHTKEGIEIHLTHVDAQARWQREQNERARRIRNRLLELAQSRYLVARTETDLEGRAGFVRVPPGRYFLSSLDAEALAGDVRLRWDAPVEVREGETTRLELSNLNAVQPERSGQS